MTQTQTATTPAGDALTPHDGVSEVFVCRACGHETDAAVTIVAYEDDRTYCPRCASADTRWLYAPVSA